MSDAANLPTSAQTGRTGRTKSRFVLLLLVLVFFAPLAVVFVLRYGGNWQPQGNTQHGDLIDPARPLPQIILNDMEGKPMSATFLHTRWSLVFIGDGECDTRCRNALADIRRTRELLGKDISRVQEVFLVAAHCCASEYLNSTHPRLIVGRIDTVEAASLLALFPVYGDIPIAAAGRIYIVDPLGNLMMSYAPDASSVGMYNDLKKLLKYSHIG